MILQDQYQIKYNTKEKKYAYDSQRNRQLGTYTQKKTIFPLFDPYLTLR